jgi:PAS domain-containing protein
MMEHPNRTGGDMAQQPVELILLKQWASYLALPIWLVNQFGDLLYYNEPAEGLLGVRFDEAGELHADQLAERFHTTALDGNPFPNENLPIVVALRKRIPNHATMRVKAFDGVWRELAITAFPVEGQGGRHLGAVAMFWEKLDT